MARDHIRARSAVNDRILTSAEWANTAAAKCRSVGVISVTPCIFALR